MIVAVFLVEKVFYALLTLNKQKSNMLFMGKFDIFLYIAVITNGIESNRNYKKDNDHKAVKITCVTGKLAFSLIKEMAVRMEEALPNLTIEVIAIRNDFFGELITVTGLITATDLMNQLKDRELGDSLCIHECMLRSGEEVFLDDYSVSDVMSTLQVKVDIVKSNGGFLSKILEIYDRNK